MNACWVSQSVFYEVLNAVNDDVFKKKCLFNGKIIFHSAFKKDTEKVVLFRYWKWKAWCKLLSSSGLKKFCVRFYHQASSWGAWWNISYKSNCAHLKMKNSSHSATQFGWWSLKKKKKSQVHISSPWCMHAPNVETRHTQNFFIP